MKRIAVVTIATAMFVGMLAAPSGAQPPRHSHMLVLGVEFDEAGDPVGFRRCVDLAGGRRLPLTAHHAHLHTGTAGEALRENAGHIVVPGAPVTPWANCEQLIAFFFGS